MQRNRFDTLAALALALLAAACAPHEDRAPSRIALTDCRLPHYDAAIRCGTLEVAENREAANGRTIALKIAVFPANTRSAKPDPLFLLAGGPGQAATETFPRAMGAFEQVRNERDIVLVDQRGTGGSNTLACPALEPKKRDFASAELGLSADLLRACLNAIHADTRQYATRQFVADLEAVRAALGYPRVNLWGGSYGTRAALEYLHRYPQRVRSVVLDGVAPGAMRVFVDGARSSNAALDRLFADCESNAACAKAFPAVREDFASTLNELDAQPRMLSLPDSATGAPLAFKVTRSEVSAAIGQFLYSPDSSALLPYLIAQAKQNNYAPLFADMLRPTNEFQAIVPGLLLSVLCADDASRIAPDDVRASETALLQRGVAKQLLDACALWPHDATPPDIGEPVRSDVPVLILSGALDPVTPPRWGEFVAHTLPNSRHFVAPGYGHLVTPRGCAPRLVARFVRDGSAAGLDGTCLHATQRPPFFVNALGPAA